MPWWPAWRPSLPGLLAVAVLAIGAAHGWARGGRPVTLVALGDSLTAGYGLSPQAAFPAVLEQALRGRGYAVTVINAGVSGDTATGGYGRLDAAIAQGADGVILELGANDMLRSADPDATRQTLAAIIGRLQQRGIPVLLTGMRAVPERGPVYAGRFAAIYPDLAQRYGVTFYPFFLQGVARVPGLNLADGIHPNAAGVRRIVQGILPITERFVARLGAGR